MRIKRTIFLTLTLVALAFGALACRQNSSAPQGGPVPREVRARPLAPETSTALRNVIEAALEQTEYTRYYDPSYVVISYPGGDVPPERGACTDVIVRAFRKG
ncbi:MAG TPA: DUF1287 domain-containing protein, partial [Pyrinomonadaceae bacterium]|nr:DUF1287 domain-containing protein [Pyrinomonadaceae bacterium]